MLWRHLEEGFQVPLWGMFLVSWWFLFKEMLEDLVEGSCGKILRFRCGGSILGRPGCCGKGCCGGSRGWIVWKDFEVPLWGVDIGTPVVLWKVMLWRISWRDIVAVFSSSVVGG